MFLSLLCSQEEEEERVWDLFSLQSPIPDSNLPLYSSSSTLQPLFTDPSLIPKPGMAERSRLGLFALLFFTLFEFLQSNSIRNQEHALRQLTPSMVLPLILSTPNFSRRIDDSYRRQLKKAEQRHPNAGMRLFDDLLFHGYYTTRIWIGTPPQEFALIVDSGSTVTYVPCSTCERCGRHQDPRFQPDLSSSYKPVKCSVGCSCDSENKQCTYERRYAEMSSSSGVLGEDIISFGNASALKPQRAVFGCENEETGDIYRQHADGIMGLGRGRLSIMDQLVDKGVISDSFSLCYGGMDVGGGAMILGGISPPPDMVFSRSDSGRSPYYNIELKEIHVAGKPLKLNPRVFDGKHGSVLDSGTTYAYLPEAAFVAFKDAILDNLNHLTRIQGPDPNYNDICFAGAGSNASELSKSFPVVDMVFGNEQKLSLSAENYLFRHSRAHGAYCLGVFQNRNDPSTLLGGIIVRNTLVTYDREHEKIGFLKTNCSKLWETLHIPQSPPTPEANALNSSTPKPNVTHNSTSGVSPAIAPGPSGVPAYISPDDFQVGLITFDMSLSVNYTTLKPHITELMNIISRELEVNTSQVHLLNFTGKGNESIIRWSIHPASPAQYFSNATTLNIYNQLAEHHVKLPATFGTYHLDDWKVGPPSKRPWLEQHFIAVLLSVFITLALCLSTFGIWYAWKQRQQDVIPYKPVSAEQELQPLEVKL